jgi:hypothetical protein
MTRPSTLESLARRYANQFSEERLRSEAETASKGDPDAAAVYALALKIREEDRSLMASLAATDYMGDAVYDLRPRRLPSDGVGR